MQIKNENDLQQFLKYAHGEAWRIADGDYVKAFCFYYYMCFPLFWDLKSFVPIALKKYKQLKPHTDGMQKEESYGRYED